MSMRDLILWGRQSGTEPALLQEGQRSPFLSLRRDIDRLFGDVFRGSMGSFGMGRSDMAWPRVEASETDREIRITAEVPGMSDKDIELLVEDGVLILRGEKKSETEQTGYSERFYGRFERRIALPTAVDDQAAKADFRDGVLIVTLAAKE